MIVIRHHLICIRIALLQNINYPDTNGSTTDLQDHNCDINFVTRETVIPSNALAVPLVLIILAPFEFLFLLWLQYVLIVLSIT